MLWNIFHKTYTLKIIKSRVDYPNNYTTYTDPLSSVQFYVNYVMYYMLISNTKKYKNRIHVYLIFLKYGSNSGAVRL